MSSEVVKLQCDYASLTSFESSIFKKYFLTIIDVAKTNILKND